MGDRLNLRKLWLGIGWALVAAIIYLSLTPVPLPLPGEEGDKLGHLAAYAAVMLWFTQLHAAPRARVALACAFTALGIGLEFAQLLTPTRTFEIADMAADAAGVAIGWLIAPPRTGNFLRRFEAFIA